MRRLFLPLLIASAALAGVLKVNVVAAPRLAGIKVYGFAGNWLLVDDSPESRARLVSAGVAYDLLPGPASHAVVLPSGLELRTLTSDEARGLRLAGTDVVTLPVRPFPLRLPDERNIPRRVLQDTFIQRIIQNVSPDSIRARMVRLQAVRTRYTSAESCRSAEQYLHDYLVSLGLDSVQFDTYMTGYRNVIGTKLGRTRSDVILVIGGHMDAISEDPWNLAPGMEDNASGTCAAIEAARILARENLDYTVKFCAFTGEEQGLYGSDHYARLLRSQNANVIAMLNYDMISWPGDSWGMALAGLAKRLGQYEAAIMDEYTTLHHRLAVRSFPSDSRSFDLVGYPAMSGFEYGSRGYVWYHTTGDTLGNCNLDLAAEATQAAVATLVSLAVAPLAPESLRLADCGNGTSLRASWAANTEPDLAGYKLLWGAASTTYSDSVALGRVTSHRIDGLVSGTRYYATVVAIDSAGHESGTAPEDSAVPSLFPLAPSGTTCWPFYFGNGVIWNRSRELDIQGYNVYRSTLPDTGFTRLNSALIADTTLRDSGLMSDTMYYYRCTAVDSAGHEGPASVTVRGKPTTLDHGILLVDETRDGSGQPGSPSDAQQDAFWHAMLSGYNYTDWDVNQAGAPLGADFGPYSTIVWHADDYTQQLADTAVPGLANHLAHGGRLWYSGWKPVLGLVGSGSYPFTFSPGQFLYDFGHLAGAQQQAAGDFIAAEGRAGYPSVSVDSFKMLSGLHGKLPYVDCPLPRDADTILTFISYSGDTFQGKPVGTRWIGGPRSPSAIGTAPRAARHSPSASTLLTSDLSEPSVVLFGFPFYYTRDPEARLVARRVLEDLGEPYGIAEGNSPLVTRHSQLLLWPNPARDRVLIRYSLPSPAPAHLALYDASGRLVLAHSLSAHRSSFIVDLRSLSSGLYFCRLSAPSAQATRRLVVQR